MCAQKPFCYCPAARRRLLGRGLGEFYYVCGDRDLRETEQQQPDVGLLLYHIRHCSSPALHGRLTAQIVHGGDVTGRGQLEAQESESATRPHGAGLDDPVVCIRQVDASCLLGIVACSRSRASYHQCYKCDCHKKLPLYHSRSSFSCDVIMISTCFPVADHLLSLVGNMGTHVRQPPQNI